MLDSHITSTTELETGNSIIFSSGEQEKLIKSPKLWPNNLTKDLLRKIKLLKYVK